MGHLRGAGGACEGRIGGGPGGVGSSHNDTPGATLAVDCEQATLKCMRQVLKN